MLKRLVLSLAALAVLAAPASALTPAQRAAVLATPAPLAAQIDFIRGVYAEKGQRFGSFLGVPGANFARNSPETCLWANGSVTFAPSGVPCVTDLGLGSWQASANAIPNSMMAGAAAVSQVGGNGTQPTGWTTSANGDGLTWQLVGVSQQAGYQCADERLFGTTTGTGVAQVYMAGGTSVAAAQGQQWTTNVLTKLVAGSTANLGVPALSVGEMSNGAYIGGTTSSSALALGANLTRVVNAHTVSNASANGIEVYLNISVAGTGLPVDLTFRVCAPQAEQLPFWTPFMPTSGAAASRAADVAYLTGNWLNTPSWAVMFDVQGVANQNGLYPNPGAVSDGTTNNYLQFYAAGGSGGTQVNVVGHLNGASVVAAGLTGSPLSSGAARVGAADFGGLIYGSANGSAPFKANPNAWTPIALSRLYIGSNMVGGQAINGYVKRAIVTSTGSLSSLQALTR